MAPIERFAKVHHYYMPARVLIHLPNYIAQYEYIIGAAPAPSKAILGIIKVDDRANTRIQYVVEYLSQY